MSTQFKRKQRRPRYRTAAHDEEEVEFESTHHKESESTYHNDTFKPEIKEYEFNHDLIGKYIKLKDMHNNNDCLTYQIQSISSPVRLRQDTKYLNSEKEKEIPQLVAESTNKYLLLHSYRCRSGEPTERTNFVVALTVIFLQILSYAIMSYYLINTRIGDENDAKQNCYGPNCNINIMECMDIKTGFVAAILLMGYVLADFINAFDVFIDSFKGCQIIHHKQFFGSLIILLEAFMAAGCGILVAVYSETDFDAINGAVGILCVHDLDEKIYAAVNIMKKKWKILLSMLVWILLSVVIAMGSACIYKEHGTWFGGSMGACKDGEFKCETGKCIWEGFVCNGVRNCRGGIDERQNCNFTQIKCPENMFRCISTGRCIEKTRTCDGILDCKDGSDEGRGLNCGDKIKNNITCGENPKFVKKFNESHEDHNWYMKITGGYFKCNNGQCIKGEYLCDATYDCIDKSDEYPMFNGISKWPHIRKCPYSKLIICNDDQVLCKTNGQCIGKLRVCDGNKDCSDGEDEKNCPWIWGDPWCEILDQYQCGGQIAKIDKEQKYIVLFENETVIHYQHITEILLYAGGDDKCIPMHYRCDGIRDCQDGDDEELCHLFECKGDRQSCQNGQCIPSDWRCSHIPFCEEKQYAGETKEFFSNCDWQQNPGHMKCNETITDIITENSGYWSEYIIDIACPVKAVKFTTCNDWTLEYNTIIEGWDEHFEIQFSNDDAGWMCEPNYSASTVILNSDRFICGRKYVVFVGGKYQQSTAGNYGFEVICRDSDFDINALPTEL